MVVDTTWAKDKAVFKDAEMEKVDSMFEDIPLADINDASEDDTSTEEGAGSMSPADDGKSEYEKALEEAGTDPALAKTEEEGWVPSDDEWASDVTDPNESNESSPEEIEAFLAELETQTDETNQAAAGLEEAAKSGDMEKVLQELDTWKQASAEKDRTIANLSKQIELEKQNSDKLLEDKFILEADSKENSKIAEAIMGDDALKSLIAFKSKAGQNDSYKAKYVDMLKQMYEEAAWVSIDDLVASSRTAEKSMMWGSSYWFEWTTPDTGSMWGMFEDVPLAGK